MRMAGAGTAVGAEDVLFLVRKVGSALCAPARCGVQFVRGMCRARRRMRSAAAQLHSCLLGRAPAPRAPLHRMLLAPPLICFHRDFSPSPGPQEVRACQGAADHGRRDSQGAAGGGGRRGRARRGLSSHGWHLHLTCMLACWRILPALSASPAVEAEVAQAGLRSSASDSGRAQPHTPWRLLYFDFCMCSTHCLKPASEFFTRH